MAQGYHRVPSGTFGCIKRLFKTRGYPTTRASSLNPPKCPFLPVAYFPVRPLKWRTFPLRGEIFQRSDLGNLLTFDRAK